MKIVAHQGGMESAPGNTLAAFEAAARLRPDVVELDVHLGRSGALVVAHDAPAGTADAPTLEDVLAALVPVPGLVLQIDIKPDWSGAPYPGMPEALRRCLAPRDLGPCLLLSSFDPAVLRSAIQAVPGARGRAALMLATTEVLGGAMNALAAYRSAGATVVDVHKDMLDAALLHALRQQGLEVGVATVNAPEAISRWMRLGVDRLVTDHPELAMRLRAERKLKRRKQRGQAVDRHGSLAHPQPRCSLSQQQVREST